jgi:DoxX-like family
MASAAQSSPVTQTNVWPGRIVSALPVLFLVFDATIKLVGNPAVTQAFTQLGLPITLVTRIAALEVLCLILYVLPSTAVLGTVLLTGFLGGAVALHVRVADPLFSHVLFPVYVGVLLWGGLFLRDRRVRSLLPLRK